MHSILREIARFTASPFFTREKAVFHFGIRIEVLVFGCQQDLSNVACNNKEELRDVRNDYRHFVGLMASGFGSWSDVRRNFTRPTFGRCRSFRNSTSHGQNGCIRAFSM